MKAEFIRDKERNSQVWVHEGQESPKNSRAPGMDSMRGEGAEDGYQGLEYLYPQSGPGKVASPRWTAPVSANLIGAFGPPHLMGLFVLGPNPGDLVPTSQ